jgi:hypothetical protein
VRAGGVAAGVLAVRSWLRVRSAAPGDPVVETGIDAVLFWGGWGALVGVLGTVGGIAQEAGAIERLKRACRRRWSGAASRCPSSPRNSDWWC